MRRNHGIDWEQRKLNFFLTVSNERNTNESFSRQDVLSVSGDYGIVNQIEFQGRSFAGKSVKNYHVVREFDVVYTKSPLKSSPYGIIKTNLLRDGIVSTLYAVYKPKNTLFSPIIELYYDSNARLNNYLRPLVNKGAKNDMKVNNNSVLNGKVNLPVKSEQILICGILDQLKKVIASNQRNQKSPQFHRIEDP